MQVLVVWSIQDGGQCADSITIQLDYQHTRGPAQVVAPILDYSCPSILNRSYPDTGIKNVGFQFILFLLSDQFST